MDHSAFTTTHYDPAPPQSSESSGMTPIARLMPHQSARTGHSEQPPREISSQGPGAVPPIPPRQATRYQPYDEPRSGMPSEEDGGNIVSEILQDVQRGTPPPREAPPTRETDPRLEQPPRVRFQEPPEYDYDIEREEELLKRPASRSNPGQSSEDDDGDSDSGLFSQDGFITTILTETKLPILVAGLFFLVGLPYMDVLLKRLIPAILQGDTVRYVSLGIKSVISGLLYYVLQRLL